MKISRYIVFISSLLPLALSTVHASPLLVVNEDVSVFFDGSSSLVWQSNVFFDDEEEEDELMLVISPGFEVNAGSNLSGFDAVITGSYEIQRFDERSELSDEYLHLSAVASYRGARSNLNAAYSFDEEQTTAGELGTLGSQFIEIHRTRAHVMGEYVLSPKFSIESGVRYNDLEYEENVNFRLADIESFSIPIDVFYELTPKVDFSFGYEYTADEVRVPNAEDYDRVSNFLNLGMRGKLLPKLNGFFKVGFRSLNPEGSTRETDQILGLSADLTYLATPKLTANLRLNRGFAVGSEGQSVENTFAKLDLDYVISGNYAARLFTHLTYQDFKDGNDGQDFITKTGFRFLYMPNEYCSFGTGYSYFENESNRFGQGFVNHILDISASLRY